MISRVAESCYWLGRYLERAESVARLVSVNRLVVLDAGLRGEARWRPVLVVLGELEAFAASAGLEACRKDEAPQEYLTWSRQSPGSLHECLRWARENARTTREVISREVWEAINRGWQWLNDDDARKLYRRDRVQFFQQVRSLCAEVNGETEATMLHEEPRDFMRIGTLVERVSQTARLMDVRNHRRLEGPGPEGDVETPWQAAQWTAQLRLCAALEPFFKRSRETPDGPRVTEFLLRDGSFPRSVRFCLSSLHADLERVRSRLGPRAPSGAARLVSAELSRIESTSAETLFASGLPEEVARLVATSAALHDQLGADFFSPSAAS